MDLYLAVDKEILDTENTTLTGKFFSKVYEGAFRDTKNGVKILKVLLLLKITPLKVVHVIYNLSEMRQEVRRKLCRGGRSC
jgi:hypothetical protein